MSKILICGTSGIGKTTLAKYVAEKYNIPFLNGSSTVLWKKYGVTCHKELLLLGINEPEKGLEFQYELLDVRKKLLEGHDEYVTDRSIVDNLVYFLYQNAPYVSDKEVREYIRYCLSTFSIYDRQNKWIFLTRQFYVGNEMPVITNDNKRIENNYFQDVINDIYDRVFEKRMLGLNLTHYGNYLKLRDYNWETRIEKVNNFIYG